MYLVPNTLNTTCTLFIWVLLWLSPVCWARTLDTLKWDILATDVAVYFDSKPRKPTLLTYQSISTAKVSRGGIARARNEERVKGQPHPKPK